jgi:hypothetical protein
MKKTLIIIILIVLALLVWWIAGSDRATAPVDENGDISDTYDEELEGLDTLDLEAEFDEIDVEMEAL